MPRGPHDQLTGGAGAAALAVLATGQFLVVLNTSVINVALPAIDADLRLGAASTTWAATVYVLAFGALLLAGGRVVDLLGQARALTGATAVFTLAALLAGLAPDGGVLIAGRALQGAAAALLVPAALSSVTLLFPADAARRRALAVWGGVASAGGGAGVLLGGVLTDALGWRAAFLLNVPIGLALLVVVPRVLRLPASTRGSRRRGLDLPGAAVSSLGVGCVVLSLSNAREDGWTAITTSAPLLVGAGLLALFVVVERRSSDPLVPLALLRLRHVALGNAVMLLGGAALFPTMLLLSLYLQAGLGHDASRAGLGLLPVTVGTVVAAALAPRLLRRARPSAVLAVALLVVALGLAWLARVPAQGRYLADVLAPALLFGLGLGLAFVSATLLAVGGLAAGGIAPRHAPLASALVNTSQQVGGAVGLTAVLGLAQARTAARLEVLGPGGGAEALVSGFRLGFAVAAALVVLGVAAAAAWGRE